MCTHVCVCVCGVMGKGVKLSRVECEMVRMYVLKTVCTARLEGEDLIAIPPVLSSKHLDYGINVI